MKMKSKVTLPWDTKKAVVFSYPYGKVTLLCEGKRYCQGTLLYLDYLLLFWGHKVSRIHDRATAGLGFSSFILRGGKTSLRHPQHIYINIQLTSYGFLTSTCRQAVHHILIAAYQHTSWPIPTSPDLSRRSGPRVGDICHSAAARCPQVAVFYFRPPAMMILCPVVNPVRA